jgi:Ciliary BBSome complex subunit 2, middle region
VLSIILLDIDEDDAFELVVGCEDGQILVYKDENIMYEMEQNSAVTQLCSFGIKNFGYLRLI